MTCIVFTSSNSCALCTDGLSFSCRWCWQVGVVSEREYVQKIATRAYKRRGFAHQVVDIMRPASEVKFITAEETVEDAMLAMADHPAYQSTHRHLPVLAADGQLAGMLSIRCAL